MGRPHQALFSQKTRLNDLSYGVKIWTDLSTVLSQYTRLSDRRTDRRTDGRTELFSPLDRVCIHAARYKLIGQYQLQSKLETSA